MCKLVLGHAEGTREGVSFFGVAEAIGMSDQSTVVTAKGGMRVRGRATTRFHARLFHADDDCDLMTGSWPNPATRCAAAIGQLSK
jgi:hypothetical protein